MTTAPPDASFQGPRGSVSPDSPSWRRRAPTAEEFRTDLFITLGLFCCSVLSLVLFRPAGFIEDPAGPITSALCLMVTVLPLAWRRRYPAAVTSVVAGGFILVTELQVPEMLVINIALFLALYSLGAWGRRKRTAHIVRWSVIAAMALWLLIAFFRVSLDDPLSDQEAMGPGGMTPALAYMLYQLLINVLYFSAAIWFGHHAWESARDRARLEERAAELQAERATVAAQAVSLERLHIARELHDSVAHHVSVMGVQAAAARVVLTQDTAKAERSIRLVEDSARRSVAELHSLLGTLREQPLARSGVEKSPFGSATSSGGVVGVGDLEDLVAEARMTGLHVSHQVLGKPSTLRPLVSMNLYRIAQEALTNVRKHAGEGTKVDLRLRYRRAAVELEVTDDGSGKAGNAARGASGSTGGHGLIGMRERVAAMDGELTATTQASGGFTVRAEVPLPEESPTLWPSAASASQTDGRQS
ncbi:sensor histidine kinase [Nesterenkonia halotolerans]|uniref:sensor histidine kinase n=1 Tax=Nesterenkonia halotolerans TaxID=225325 RepID=UPI003EE61B00